MTGVIVRYQSFAANAVRVHQFPRSVAVPPKGDGNCELVKVERFASPLSASFTSRSFSGTRDKSRIWNLFGPFKAARRFVSSLRQFRQEPRSVFAVSFRPGPFVALIHAHNKAWSQKHDVHRNQASGAKSYE